VDDGRFVLEKHTELDSYSPSSLKQQSTGRYDDGGFHIYPWTVASVCQHYKNPTQRVCLVQRGHHHIYLGRFVLDKHAELDSYSASSLKQQSTGRYESQHHHIYPWTVVSVSQHYKNPTQRVCLVQSDHLHSPQVDMMMVAFY
jgi:hypothetical protein